MKSGPPSSQTAKLPRLLVKTLRWKGKPLKKPLFSSPPKLLALSCFQVEQEKLCKKKDLSAFSANSTLFWQIPVEDNFVDEFCSQTSKLVPFEESERKEYISSPVSPVFSAVQFDYHCVVRICIARPSGWTTFDLNMVNVFFSKDFSLRFFFLLDRSRNVIELASVRIDQ